MKATAAAEDRKLTGSTKYKVCVEVARTFTNLCCYFVFSSVHVRSWARSSVRSYVRSFIRSSVCSFVRSFVRSYLCSFVHSFVRTFVHSSFIRSFVRTYVRWGTYVRSFVCLLGFFLFRPSFLASALTHFYDTLRFLL